MPKSLVLGGLLMAAACRLLGQTPSPYVYQVDAGGCSSRPAARIMTGFRVNDPEHKGIFTALHGVIGCSQFSARAGNSEIYTDLYIKSIDAEADTALLSSNLLESMDAQGLQVAGSVSWDNLSNATIIVYGHPFGTGEHGDRLLARIPAVHALQDEVPAGISVLLNRRSSPSMKLQVLSLQGPLSPGDSGAPILIDGLVVGIANGGLLGGTSGLGWAIRYSDISLSLPDPEVLARLARLPVDGLFDVESGNGGGSSPLRQITASLQSVIDGSGTFTSENNYHTADTDLRFRSLDACVFQVQETINYTILRNDAQSTDVYTYKIPMSQVEMSEDPCTCVPPRDAYKITLKVSDGINRITFDSARWSSDSGNRTFSNGIDTDSWMFEVDGKNRADAIAAALKSAIDFCHAQ